MSNRDSEKTPWQWWAGDNDDMYGVGPCKTREKAVAQAIREQLCYVEGIGGPEHRIHLVEAQNAPLRLADWIDLDRMLEVANEALWDSDRVSCDYEGEDTFFAPNSEQEDDLQARIKAAVNEWQDAHKIVVTPNTFSATRNHEFLVVPAQPEQQA